MIKTGTGEMNDKIAHKLNDVWIRAQRGDKNKIDLYRPYAYNVEKERTLSGKIEDVATIFLTNKDEKVPSGAIPKQIEWALNQLPPTPHIKLYNSGNFFDVQAVPADDYNDIATLLKDFETVIVESHPKLINDKALRFRDLIGTELQVAVGLETVHPEVLPKLNKAMNLNDFRKSADFLHQNNIRSRAFILLRPPFLTEDEGIEWTKRSLDFAFDCGVECCVIIPTRSGNGALDILQKEGYFTPPDIKSLEEVLDYGIGLKSGRIFADLWDIDLFSSCDKCLATRKIRLENTNLYQEILTPVNCSCDRNSVI
jgi:radical SAM enzyme (TIGR01210 family)